MKRTRFALRIGEPERLEFEWEKRSGLGKFVVYLDGEEVGRHDGTDRALGVGLYFDLPGDDELHVIRKSGMFGPELLVECGGIPVPGSSGDPVKKVREAGDALLFVFGITAIGSVLALVTGAAWLLALGLGWESLIFSGVYGLLGWFGRKGSVVALALGAAIYAADTFYVLVAMAEQGGGVGSIFVRLAIFAFVLRGIPHAFALRQNRKAQPHR